MLRAIICICTALVIAAFAMPRASADARGKARRAYADTPTKDCTRLNGRWGYYGNPWCSPAEQLRWDRWDGRRAGR
jgi:hypothetical protein